MTSEPPADAHKDLLRLMTWLSPSFPTGAYSYSQGLEWAIDAGVISHRPGLVSWLTDVAERGSGWNDAVLLAAAWRGENVAQLAEALSPSQERHLETMQQGAAFAAAASHWAVDLAPAPYPVVVGTICSRLGIPLEAALTAWLNSMLVNLVSVAVRLVPIGQVEGLLALRALEPVILSVAGKASRSSLDDLGSATICADIAAMKHEVQISRIFRS